MSPSIRRLAKTGTYWILHIGVAVTVGWAVTGSLAAGLAIGLIEPTVQAVAYWLHERAWERAPTAARAAR
ncbi:MAG: DUF2061 domain-containing protein [Thermaurantiacus sp.]